MPWFDGSHIYTAIEHFWRYIFSKEFKDDLHKIHPDLKVRYTDIIVSGDSAGSWLAMHSLITPDLAINRFDGTTGPLHIGAVFAQYPMLRHYQRTVPAKGAVFMGLKRNGIHIREHGEALRKAWGNWHAALKKAEISPFDVDIPRPWAPFGMQAAFLSSHNHPLWKDMFQNGNTDLKDIPERLQDKATQKSLAQRKSVPWFYIYHGDKDINCPIQDTRDTIALLKQCYEANPYRSSDRDLCFFFSELKDIDHGFDHDFGIEDLKCLKEFYGSLNDFFILGKAGTN